MKCLLSSSAILLIVLVALMSNSAGALRSSTSASPFVSNQEEAKNFANLGLEGYIGRLNFALRSTSAVKTDHSHLVQHINYYKSLQKAGAVKESHRDEVSGTVHDCVPFQLQPALFSASQAEIEDAVQNWMAATNGKKSVQAVCSSTTDLPVPRPIVRFAKNSYPKLSIPSAKRENPSGKTQVPPGYSYVDSAFAHTEKGTQWTYTVLGVGDGVKSRIPQTPFGSQQDHSINQMWWTTNKTGQLVNTLEAGWIHSSYWSFVPETMLFVFSTPDGYQGSKYDQYNYAGDFIGYPGAPALQKTVHSVQYLWKYEIMSDKKGYEMKLTPFGNNSDYTGYAFGDEIALGYFPMKRYTDHPDFNTLQTGQELDQSSNSSQLQAGGKIFGWGTDTVRFPIKGNFTDFGNPIGFSYGTTPNFKPRTSFTGEHYVAFHGDNCGDHC